MKSTIVDGEKVTIGDTIGFKADREDSGTLVAIRGRELVIEVYDAYTCQTKKQWVPVDRCWKE